MSSAEFQRAVALHAAGSRAAAQSILAAVLERHPDHAEAWQLQGVIALEDADPAAAVAHFRRALEVQPDYAEAHMNLGNALIDLHRVAEALPELRKAIRLAPHLAMAHNSLGVAFQRLGQWQAAAAAHQRAIELRADYAEAWTNLGNAQRALGHFEQAIAAHGRALTLQPDYAAAYANLGAALYAAGRFEEAIAAYRQAVARNPDLAEVHNDLGMTLRAAGRPQEALASLELARVLAENEAVTHYNIGVVLGELGRLDEARAALRHAVALDPRSAPAHYALGNVMRDLGAVGEAVEAFRAAVRHDPSFGEAWSNLLFLLNFRPGESDTTLVQANLEWAATVEETEPISFCNDRDPQRRLRIAYVSTEFRRHHFLAEFLPVLQAHDRAQFHLVCYADVAAPDRDTQLIAELADGFRNLHGLSSADQAEAIRADGIDILVGLTGYLAKDRQLLIHRMAPIQATYINHLTSTGLRTVDYRITDEWLDPIGGEVALDPETPLRLASGFSVFAPPDNAPAVEKPPSERNGFVTFGCFNNLLKVTDETLTLWARLLDRVAGARLLIKARDLSRAGITEAFRERLRSSNIDPARCDLIGYVADARDNLAFYVAVDIGLDPVPFTGGATTREMLWMGLPVVTLAGATRASRIGHSLLRRAGMAELVAHTPTDYVEIAAMLASDPGRLSRLRAEQRSRLSASALLDARSHTRELEAAYRGIWQRWCALAPA